MSFLGSWDCCCCCCDVECCASDDGAPMCDGAVAVGVCAGDAEECGTPRFGKRFWLALWGADCAPAIPPGYPDTGDEVSKPLSCAEVYICGTWLPEMVVSGRWPLWPYCCEGDIGRD